METWVLTRKHAARERSFNCPICPRRFYSLRGVALHLAMKKDEAHTSWRVANFLPESNLTMTDAIEIVGKIIEILKGQEELQQVC